MSEHMLSVIADLEGKRDRLVHAIETLRALVEPEGESVPTRARTVKRKQASKQASKQRDHPQRSVVRPPGRSAGPDPAVPDHGDALVAKIPDRFEGVMDAIAHLGTGASTSALAKAMAVGQAPLKTLLKAMVANGKVRRAGTGPRNFHWMASEKSGKAAPAKKTDEVGEVVWDGARGRNVSLSGR